MYYFDTSEALVVQNNDYSGVEWRGTKVNDLPSTKIDGVEAE
jgi:hypothetical protein